MGYSANYNSVTQPPWVEAAQVWYHAELPGGMPKDWITDRPENPYAAQAAWLAVTDQLHDGQYVGCGPCVEVKIARLISGE